MVLVGKIGSISPGREGNTHSKLTGKYEDS
jgi:hypothetical protein